MSSAETRRYVRADVWTVAYLTSRKSGWSYEGPRGRTREWQANVKKLEMNVVSFVV
jgi:hypothetical protein